jgi:hypothetical protein
MIDSGRFPSKVIQEFGLEGSSSLLPGGSTQTFRVGSAVLKRIRETSLENNGSPVLAAWMANFSSCLPQEGFRIPGPIQTVHSTWITPDGWTAMTYLEGRQATADDIPECIPAILAFHRVLKMVPKHPLLDANETAWGKAHRWCWGEKPAAIQPKLRPLVDRLYTLRRPIPPSEQQLIHGDLNPENILVAPGMPPAFLDLSPFWGTPEFAMAIFANFIGPRRGDASILGHFGGVPHFDQLLIRAGIRMLLVMAVLDHLEDWETCSEKRAAELIIDFVSD